MLSSLDQTLGKRCGMLCLGFALTTRGPYAYDSSSLREQCISVLYHIDSIAFVPSNFIIPDIIKQ